MGNEELLDKFASYLDAALNMDLQSQVADILNVKGNTALLRCHRNAQQAYGLRLRPDAFRDAGQTKQITLAVVKRYSVNHALQGMTRKGYCSCTTERSFERAALRAFFGFLQILQATR